MRNKILVAVFVALLLLSGCGKKDPPEAQALYQTALDLERENKLNDALFTYKELLEKYPTVSYKDRIASNIKFIEEMFEIEKRGKARRAVEDLKKLARACERYFVKYNKYPAKLEDLIPDFIDAVPPLDPWGFPYNYRTESDERGKPQQRYFLASFGADGAAGGREDAFDLIVKDGEFFQLHEWLR